MSAVVSLGDFKNKGTVTLLRELLGKAVRGQVAGIAFNVEFWDGTRKTGFTGVYKGDPAKALRVANRLNQQTDVQTGDDHADSSFDDPTGVVRRLRK